MVAVESGEAAAGLAERLAREAARLDNLELLPLLPRDEVIALIRRSLAVVATSEAEGMPNIFLESWSAGVPVISLNFDPDGAIERERAGVAAAGSWQRFVAGVDAIAADPALRREMGARGREFVRDHHSLDAVADAWAQLVRSARTGAPTTDASTAMP
jgi:glycosyltransferase involved in cell wall biosynthesis